MSRRHLRCDRHSDARREGSPMKYGWDEITQAVRLNDSMGSIQEIPEIFQSFEVDNEAAQKVAFARAEMVIQTVPGPKNQFVKIACAASFLDGFAAALHMLEQS